MAELIRQPFGLTSDRREVDIWTLRAGRYAIQVLTYGGILRSWMVPAPEGSRDIVLGCETLAQYEAQDKYLGALVGRVANRIGGASFELNGVTYHLAVNNGPNCLHGGLHGFNEAVWKAREEDGVLVLSYVSPAGEEGFPGTLRVQVTYTLTEEGALTLDYQAESDADTLCNLTNTAISICWAMPTVLWRDSGSRCGRMPSRRRTRTASPPVPFCRWRGRPSICAIRWNSCTACLWSIPS